MLLFLCESFLLFRQIVGPGIESESLRVFPAGAKESDSLFYDFSRIVPTLKFSNLNPELHVLIKVIFQEPAH
jgi:hypothetical protein